jgi:5-methylcytosine-specific restriction endonuclease McrA
VNAWAGWSTVLGPVGDAAPSSDPYDAVYSHPIPLKREIWLSKAECVFTARATGNWREWDRMAYHRKPSYQRISDSAAGPAIVELINRAKGSRLQPDERFNDDWDPKRLGYLAEKAIEAAGFKCQVCHSDAVEWASKMGGNHTKVAASERPELQREGGRWFLHAHHIREAHRGGSADLRNLVSLCPNCHVFAGRMGESKFREFLDRPVPSRC